MTSPIPRAARAVVIGGGVVGCSTAYHLARLGWKDTVLLEQYEPSAGTTWHACGAVSQLRSAVCFTRISTDSIALYERLESETGQATGFRRNGGMRIAKRPERRMEFERFATTAAAQGLEVQIITPEEAGELVPGMAVDDLVCAAFTPSDGHVNPSDLVQALVKGAKQQGATIVSGVKVTGLRRRNGAIVAVEADQGAIECEVVACCAGIWSREIGAMVGAKVPIQACHHFYLVTEPVKGAKRDGPGVRDVDNLTYVLPNVGGYMCGAFEADPIPFLQSPIPPHHDYKLYDENWDHFARYMEPILHRMPSLTENGIRKLINGLEAFTPDTLPILGESPEQRRFFVCCGFNASGIGGGGGAGKALAEWIVGGEPPYDLGAVDIARYADFYRSERQTRVRVLEAIADHFAFHWPYSEAHAGRPLRRSPIYERLKANGACFGQRSGWERPNWFAPQGVEPVDSPEVLNPNWLTHVAAESKACRERVALFDLSSFAKFALVGKDAERVLQRLCAGNVGREPGRVIYTPMLNARGGIEADITVARIAEDEYYIVTGTACGVRDRTHIGRNIPAEARAALVDVSSGYGVLVLMGPRSRELLQGLAEADLSNAGLPFASVREAMVAGAPVRIIRMSMMGELGFELHTPAEYMLTVYDALKEAGRAFGLKDAGYRAINSLRLEKRNYIYPGDLNADLTPFEAGLPFTVSFKKNTDFTGRAALEKARSEPLHKRLALFALEEPEVMLIGNETIYRNGHVAGYTTSGGHGFTVGRPLAIGLVRDKDGVDERWFASGSFEIEVCLKRYRATASLKALYDPDNHRPLS